ncbi:hypothetical protein [Paenibacillus daejeonensis]|uniref:hypothetical protein n=1 Tax=Paenibacillus daejeonensis TaxID=135193 RepID=UPI00036AE359|nr:hypothetical protein [Paenibacillus daejeonensis]
MQHHKQHRPTAPAVLEIEAAPEDITITVEGPRWPIATVDTAEPAEGSGLVVYTDDYGDTVRLPARHIAVQVGANLTVTQVVRPEPAAQNSTWRSEASIHVTIPAGGFVLSTSSADHNSEGAEHQYLATCFTPGDRVKLRRGGQLIGIRGLRNDNHPCLHLDQYAMLTSVASQTTISGSIGNGSDGQHLELYVQETAAPIANDGTFSVDCSLSPGTNEIKLRLQLNGEVMDQQRVIVFCREGLTRLATAQASFATSTRSHAQDPRVILWVDQGANSRKFQSPEQVAAFLEQAQKNGVTMIVLDVLGVEGFVTYQKTTMTGRPHASRIHAAKKAGAHPDLDLLELFVHYGHQLGLEIHASINVFAEGSILYGEYGVLNQHLAWEEQVRCLGDGGAIKRQRESADPGVVAFVNPAHEEARAYQLHTFEEIMMNYEVDGIVHDRSRYDNDHADFSETSRRKFETFLANRGKQLRDWPSDIYSYAGDQRIDGPLLQDWWEFRAGIIGDFLKETRALAEAYGNLSGRRIEVSAYVGSWYESYYVHGANWCSPRFGHADKLELVPASLYTRDYIGTGYIDHLDFLMIGAYQQTAGEIEKYLTQAQIVTEGELPIYTGLAIANVQASGLLHEACSTALAHSDGLMLFDASHIEDWSVLGEAIQGG